VGQQVDPDKDEITVRGQRVEVSHDLTYLMMNKPAGVLTTALDDRGRPTVIDRLPAGSGRLFPVGRLDLPSRGLVLLTNDGELAMRLMHPRYHVEKEYRVVLSRRPDQESLRRVQEGMSIGDERFAPARVKLMGTQGENSVVTMVLREGKKREVRRLWQALGYRVIDLERVRLGPLELGSLEAGEVRPLTTDEISRLRAAAELS
jgi:pseudouridine synthase